MRHLRTTSLLVPFLAAAALWLAACAGTQSIARIHSEEVIGTPVCSECHTEWQEAYDHTAGFALGHRFYASSDQRVCETCHRPSFCAECHADKEEIKPSDKHKDAPWRQMPHLGDYLTRHQVDGRLNPASCFKCHGRRNDWRCVACHR